MKTVNVSFVPQAWINDYAIEIDPLGDTDWDISIEELCDVLGVSEDKITPDFDLDTTEGDQLRYSINSPKWIKDWSGPFRIEINSIDAKLNNDIYIFKDDNGKNDLPSIHSFYDNYALSNFLFDWVVNYASLIRDAEIEHYDSWARYGEPAQLILKKIKDSLYLSGFDAWEDLVPILEDNGNISSWEKIPLEPRWVLPDNFRKEIEIVEPDFSDQFISNI